MHDRFYKSSFRQTSESGKICSERIIIFVQGRYFEHLFQTVVFILTILLNFAVAYSLKPPLLVTPMISAQAKTYSAV